jgi:DNA transformation protein and related proteins
MVLLFFCREMPLPTVNSEFALYCCDLLSGVGRCDAKRMFGGYAIRTDGLTIALLADLGQGEKLWLKASDETRAQFVAAGCEQFKYPMKGVLKPMNYFAAPDDAMESPPLMLPWARLALEAALRAQAVAKPKPRRNAAPKPKPKPKPAKKAKPA